MSLIKNTDELFTLIKSMTMSEKRYFKIIASQHVIGGKNNYIRLFEVIEKQKMYDEEVIRKKFRAENFVKQLAVTKNYLYNLILKAMQVYNSQSTIDGELKRMVADIDFLYYKGLYGQSSKVLKKAKQFAYKYELYTSLLELLEKERRVNKDQGSDILDMEIKNNRLFEEKEEVLNKIKGIDQYLIIHDRLLLYLRKIGLNRTEEDEIKYRKIGDQLLLTDEKLITSFKSKIAFYHSNAVFSSLIGDFPNSYKYRKKLLDFVDLNPEQIEAYPETYITACNNFIAICGDQKKYKEALLHIDKLRKFKVNNDQYKARIFETGYSNELHILSETGQFEKAIAIIPEVEKGLEIYKGKITKMREIICYYNIACIYIGAGKYNDALIWNNRLLNDMEVGIRYDVLSYSRIINLIIHFELKNYEQLEYLVKSTKHFLQKQKHLYKIETIFLNFIEKKLPDVNNKKDMIKSFSELKEELISMSKKPFESYGLEYFDFISWLESKIENRPFAEIVKEKSKKMTI